MSCSTPGEDKWSEGGGRPQGGPGLVSGHAYTLLQVKQYKQHKLLNIRNPWGRCVGLFPEHAARFVVGLFDVTRYRARQL